MQPLVTPESLIAHVLRTWPQTIGVFLRHRMACVGCSMSAFDTLGDAAQSYGIDVARFVAELEAVIGSTIVGSQEGES